MQQSNAPRRSYPVEINGLDWVGELRVPVHVTGVLLCLGQSTPAEDAFQQRHVATLSLQLPNQDVNMETASITAIINWVGQHAVTRNRPITILAMDSAHNTNVALTAATKETDVVSAVILYESPFDNLSRRLLADVDCPILWVTANPAQLRSDLAVDFESLPHLALWNTGDQKPAEQVAAWVAKLVSSSDTEITPM